MDKREIRSRFRNSCLKRDGFKCRCCGAEAIYPNPRDSILDVHHIFDRHDMPNGGYVPENGITLCKKCHILAEEEHRTGKPVDGYSRENFLRIIGSSQDKAWEASERLV